MREHVRVAIAFKNFACWTGMSHVGLNVAAITNARVLTQHGIQTTVFPVRNNVDLVHCIEEYYSEHANPLTHVIISAPWLSRYDMENLISRYTGIQFVIESHSNVGFLQADPWSLKLFRDVLDLQAQYPNIRVGGNNHRFTEWMKLAYGQDVVLLPNLYPMYDLPAHERQPHHAIQIGAFGAVRPRRSAPSEKFYDCCSIGDRYPEDAWRACRFSHEHGRRGRWWRCGPSYTSNVPRYPELQIA